MLNSKKALLLIGSPKVKNSNSEALGSYLLEALYKIGLEIEKVHVGSILKNDVKELINKVNTADTIILSFPLYVDSLPSPLIRALELIADSRNHTRPDKKQNFITIINCGFPEAFHNDTALRICKVFADRNGFTWLGGLSMGAGPVINGRPIEQLGGMTRNIVKVLDMAAEAIVNDENIPSEAIKMMSNKMMPIWVYTLFGNRGWKIQAKKNNADKKLYVKPYITRVASK